MTKKYETKFPGNDKKYETGALRDSPEGKGRFDLISPIALTRLACVYERGANARGERNWEKGFSICRALCSSIRHIYQYLAGLRDEDHLAQAAWNLFAAIHFEEMIERGLLPKNLDDLPNYQAEKIEEEFDSGVALEETQDNGLLPMVNDGYGFYTPLFQPYWKRK